jgi:DNA-binding NarL/FixJ family response regulator
MNEAHARRLPRRRVLIADAYRLMREGLKSLVGDLLGPVEVREADDAESLAAALATERFGLALVDVRMPGMQGGRRLLEITRQRPEVPFVIVSAVSASVVVRQFMRIPSVHAFVPKTEGLSSLRRAIDAALAGRKLPFEPPSGDATVAAFALTPRQEEIRDLLRLGMSNKAIASALGISAGTVKNHITEIFKTLNATNRTQAAGINGDGE